MLDLRGRFAMAYLFQMCAATSRSLVPYSGEDDLRRVEIQRYVAEVIALSSRLKGFSASCVLNSGRHV